MAKKQVRDTAHWVERHEHGAALTRDMLATVPGRKSPRGSVVTMLNGLNAVWDEKADAVQISRDGCDVAIELDAEARWTWGRFVTLLVTLRAVPVDAGVKNMMIRWIMRGVHHAA